MYSHSPEDRQLLAAKIIEKLTEAGFERVEIPGCELIYKRTVNDIDVTVYTTIVGNQVRELGKDAIRVAGVYNKQGVVSDRRINRVGPIEEIVERMLERAREVWKACRVVERCDKCGAPKFVSRNGNKVCAAICWVKK